MIQPNDSTLSRNGASRCKPLLLYVGHGYHKVTESTKFFLELLSERYRVEILWDESWRDASRKIRARQVNAFNPDVVLFFQTLPVRAEISRIRCRNKIFVPMYDSVVHSMRRMRRRVRGQCLRTINFCGETQRFFSRLGCVSLQVQYWPLPRISRPRTVDGVRIFFWIRRNEIGWPTLKTILGNFRPDHILLRCAADPGQHLLLPTAEETREFNISIVEGWLEKDRYRELFEACNVYVAPRLFEGIGLSFLEAMTHGLAVVAPDLPTMNEYIRHGENGYLYDPEKIVPIDFGDLARVRESALADVVSGSQDWIRQRAKLLEFIGASLPKETLFERILTWGRRLPLIGEVI